MHSLIRKHIYDTKGIADNDNGAINYHEQRKNVALRMKAFFDLCMNRILMGRFRYGEFTPKYADYAKDLERCLKSYTKTRNTEFLVDLANYAWIEFKYGTHPDKHFKSIDDGEHSKQ